MKTSETPLLSKRNVKIGRRKGTRENEAKVDRRGREKGWNSSGERGEGRGKSNGGESGVDRDPSCAREFVCHVC